MPDNGKKDAIDKDPVGKMSTRGSRRPNIKTINVQSPTMYTLPNREVLPELSTASDDTIGKLQDFLTKKLDALEQRLMERIGSLSAEISNVRNELGSAYGKINKLEEKIVAADNEVKELRLKLVSFENAAVSSDIVVRGVPENADANDVVKRVLTTINGQDIELKSVFRVRIRSTEDVNKQCPPIIAKLYSSQQRIKLFTLLAGFRKANKRNICRGDVGLPGDAAIMVHESLSFTNRKLLKKALGYKAQQKLSAAFSLRGNVFVRRKSGDDAVLIRDIGELTQLLEN